MKLALVASLLLTAGLAQAQAASPTTTTPPSFRSEAPVHRTCAISSGGNEVDYGSLSRYQLHQQANNQLSLGKRSVPVSIACPYSRVMKFSVDGERSPDGQFRYGAQGVLQVRLSDAQLDGKPVLLTRISAGGVRMGQAAESVTILPGERIVAGDGAARVKGRTLTLNMESEPLLPDGATRAKTMERSDARLTLRLER